MSTNVFGRIFDNVNDLRQASKVVYKLYDLLIKASFILSRSTQTKPIDVKTGARIYGKGEQKSTTVATID